MSTRVDLIFSDILQYYNAGYNVIKIYRSSRKDSNYSEVTTPSTRIEILSNSLRYSYLDETGNADSWYKWSVYNTSSIIESSLSNPFRGEVIGEFLRDLKYPQELYLTTAEQDLVLRIRQLTGDFKELHRDYISPVTGYDKVHQDKKTVEFENLKGWPTSVTLDGISYTLLTEPTVRGYQFVTFSGAEINTISGTLDMWYERFRFSDREILDTYRNTDAPPGFTSSTATVEMYEVSCAIKLLELELRNFLANSSSAVNVFREVHVDPQAGLRARQEDIKALKARLADIVKTAVSSSLAFITGVRVD